MSDENKTCSSLSSQLSSADCRSDSSGHSEFFVFRYPLSLSRFLLGSGRISFFKTHLLDLAQCAVKKDRQCVGSGSPIAM